MTGFAAPPDPAGRAGDGGLRCQRAVFLPIPFLCQFREPGFSFRYSILLKQIHNRVYKLQLQVRLQLHAQFSTGTFADADFYGVVLRPNRISSRFF